MTLTRRQSTAIASICAADRAISKDARGRWFATKVSLAALERLIRGGHVDLPPGWRVNHRTLNDHDASIKLVTNLTISQKQLHKLHNLSQGATERAVRTLETALLR